MGSVGQRASKLLAVKVGGLNKKSAAWPWPHSKYSACIREQQGRIILKVLWPVTLQPKDPKILALKGISPFKTVSKIQEALF